MKVLLNNWFENESLFREVQQDVWCINEIYYLKACEPWECMKNVSLLNKMATYDIPIPKIVPTLRGEAFVIKEGKHFVLTTGLEGVHLAKSYVLAHPHVLLELGHIIGKLHRVFRELSGMEGLAENDLVQELNGWVKQNLDEFAKGSFALEVFDVCVEALSELTSSLSRQLIHRDMHLGNFLFVNDQITGYIDFDLAQINARVFDLSYFLAGWLVESIHEEGFVSRYCEAVNTVIKGYQQAQDNPLSSLEIRGIFPMMCGIELLFVAYFYSINDTHNAMEADACLKWLWDNREMISIKG